MLHLHEKTAEIFVAGPVKANIWVFFLGEKPAKQQPFALKRHLQHCCGFVHFVTVKCDNVAW